MKIYRLILPSADIDWKTALTEGLFFSSVTLLILFPAIWPILSAGYSDSTKIVLCSVLILFTSIALPFLLKHALTKTRLSEVLNLPYPTAWDYFFDLREPCFLLIHLNSGRLIGGYYGTHSYATSFPNEGDIYLERVYQVEEDGTFGNVIEDSHGLLLTRDQYKYIEIFHVPQG